MNGPKITVENCASLFMVACAGMMVFRNLDSKDVSADHAFTVMNHILGTAVDGRVWTVEEFQAVVPGLQTTHLQCFIDVANFVWGGEQPTANPIPPL